MKTTETTFKNNWSNNWRQLKEQLKTIEATIEDNWNNNQKQEYACRWVVIKSWHKLSLSYILSACQLVQYVQVHIHTKLLSFLFFAPGQSLLPGIVTNICKYWRRKISKNIYSLCALPHLWMNAEEPCDEQWTVWFVSSAGIIFRLVLVRNTRPRHIVLLDFCCQLAPLAIFKYFS